MTYGARSRSVTKLLPRSDPRPFRDRRGSGTMLTVIMIGVVIMMFAVVGVIGVYVVGDHRATTAADQSALSGAIAHADGRDACPVAERAAVRNGARMLDCQVVGDASDYVVTVSVEVGVALGWPGLPSAISATARAGQLSG